MQGDINLFIPTSLKPAVTATHNSAVSTSRNNEFGKFFTDTFRGVTADNANTNAPPIRSAKATERYEWLMQEARSDPEKADMLAHLYAYDSFDSPLVDITDLPILRLSATGEIYTPGMQLYFSHVANSVHADRLALYKA